MPNFPQTMYFKSGAEAFDYQCRYGYTTIKERTAVAALVLDAQKEFGTPTAVSISQDGSQLAALRVAGGDGGFLVFATTPSAKGDKLQPDDLVLWVPYLYKKEMGDRMSDPRSGWVGLITAKIKPEFSVADPSFVIACRYD